MELKRIAQFTSSGTVSISIGLAVCFVATGCNVLKPTDDIGDGLMSEDGWDPFGDEPRSRRSQGGDEDRDITEIVDDTFSPDPVIGEVAVKREESSTSKRLEDTFKEGDYKRALSEARVVRAKSAPGSVDRDVADFVSAASQYYLGNFQSAQPILDAHVKQFPDSRHRESSLYYQASNHVRLRQWKVGAELLDNYIASYGESLLLEFALFDRATCYAELGQNSSAVKLVERIEREFLYSKIRDRALVLKGDSLQESGDLAGAQAAYLKARTAADELKHSDLEARSLANLVTVAAARGQNDVAVKYYESFFKQYENSSYATQAARGGLPALKATGGLESGLKNMERVLQAMSQNTDASIMNETLVDYAKFYREANGPDKLLRQLGNLSSSSKGSERFKEQLIVARLEALETYFPQNKAEINVFYREMRANFKPSNLSSANALKLADYIAAESPEEAVEWYQNVLARGSSLHEARATLGLAKAQARSGKDREAEAGFRKVLDTFGSPELAEEATLGLARVAQKKKDWGTSAHYWTSYLDHKNWSSARDEARRALDEAKGHGAVAKAPPSSRTMPVKAVPNEPIAKGLSDAQSQAAAGNKNAAYDTLDALLKRFADTSGILPTPKVSLSRARVMHEELGIELGK